MTYLRHPDYYDPGYDIGDRVEAVPGGLAELKPWVLRPNTGTVVGFRRHGSVLVLRDGNRRPTSYHPAYWRRIIGARAVHGEALHKSVARRLCKKTAGDL